MITINLKQYPNKKMKNRPTNTLSDTESALTKTTLRDQFWESPLNSLNDQEWESLCDGCGLCCLHKLEDEETGDVYLTQLGCKLMDLGTCACSQYETRHQHVDDCIKLTLEELPTINWLPETCAYIRRLNGKPLPHWHYLLSGDRTLVHKLKMSLQGNILPEQFFDEKKQLLQDFIVDHPGYHSRKK